jgi:hypothetical protein
MFSEFTKYSFEYSKKNLIKNCTAVLTDLKTENLNGTLAKIKEWDSKKKRWKVFSAQYDMEFYILPEKLIRVKNVRQVKPKLKYGPTPNIKVLKKMLPIWLTRKWIDTELTEDELNEEFERIKTKDDKSLKL